MSQKNNQKSKIKPVNQTSVPVNRVDSRRKKLMETTAINSLLLYGVFVYFLRSGRLSSNNIKLSFGVIALYIGSVYLRYILNYFKVKSETTTYEKILAVAGALIILLFLLGILGIIIGG